MCPHWETLHFHSRTAPAFSSHFDSASSRIRLNMAPVEKIQGAEKAFLESKFSDYLAAAANKSYPAFWPPFFLVYFSTFPAPVFPMPDLDDESDEPNASGDDHDADGTVAPVATTSEDGKVTRAQDPTEAALKWQKTLALLRGMTVEKRQKWCKGRGIAKKKQVSEQSPSIIVQADRLSQQVTTWFRWRQSKLTHNTGARVSTSLVSLLSLSTKGGRLLTAVEKYFKLYFPQRVRIFVDAELLQFGDYPTASEKLTTIKRVTLEMWEEEDEVTRNIVFDAMARDKAKRDANLLQLKHDEDGDNRTPLQYQSAIDLLPAVLKQVFDELHRTTGWSFSVIMGGPLPEEDGKNMSATHHVGNSAAGNDWGRAYPDFDTKIIGPYQEFLRHIYPADIRRQRALQPEPEQSAKELSSPPDMLPFHEGDGHGEDQAGNDFIMDLFDNPDPMPQPSTSTMAPMVIPTNAALAPARSRSPFNQIQLPHVATAVTPRRVFQAIDGAASPAATIVSPAATIASPAAVAPSTPAAAPSPPTAAPSPPAAAPSPPAAAPSPPAVVPSPPATAPIPPVAVPTPPAATPTPPALAAVPPKLAGSVLVSSTTTVIQGQSTAAQERYAQLQVQSKARKARMAELHAMDTREDAEHAKARDADVREILALPRTTPAEEQLHFAKEKKRLVELSKANLLEFTTGTETDSPHVKEDALARLILARATAKNKPTRPRPPPKAISGPLPNSTDGALQDMPTSTDDEDVPMASADSPEDRVASAVRTREAAAALEADQAVVAREVQAREAAAARVAQEVLEQAVLAAASAQQAAAALAAASAQQVAAAEATDKARDAAKAGELTQQSTTAKKLTAAQRAAKNRKDKAAAKAAEKVRAEEAAEQARVEKEAAYKNAMAKTNSSHLLANPFSIPSKAAPWLRPLIDHLSQGELGDEWSACIHAYVALLKDMNCVDMSACLSTDQRPLEIGAWINRARKLDKPPKIAKSYLAGWMRWWCALQPAWRRGSGVLPPSLYFCEVGEWGPLRNCGKNGLYLVMLSAAWYGHAFGRESDWVTAVIDIRRALEGMVEGGGKRASSPSPSAEAPRKRYAPSHS
ncbi:hypothetical protein HWV62_4926 [Athelia sp. TMB]|nr:hypothetical protein HWV62_4926 [Athelia sp. TMB]